MISPSLLLTVLLVLTLVGLMTESIRQGRQAEMVRMLAGRWGMNFGRSDTLRLTARVASMFPVPGAATIRLFHVVYGAEGDVYRYICTAQYTLGIVGPKRRVTRVVCLTEPISRASMQVPSLTMADELLPILAQYESMRPKRIVLPADATP